MSGSIKYFYAAVIIVIITLIAMTMKLRSEATQFTGIADAQEVVVNVQSAVEIKKIRVTPGQAVNVGDTLVEVNNVGMNTQELDRQIAVLTHEIEEYKTRKNAHMKLANSEARQSKLELEDRKAEIKAELQDLQLQYDVNQTLLSDLKSFKSDEKIITDGSSASKSPILSKIEFLKNELRRLDDSAKITLNYLKDELSVDADPIEEQIRQREAQLKVMMNIKEDLYLEAKISGVIGTVNYKVGEKVDAFDTILTLHTSSPSFVSGFIHENTYSQVRLGQKVNIMTQDVRKVNITGEIIGVGSRIVEYPIRLRKYPDLLMYGREVIIKIPEQNQLLLGERVMVQPVFDNKK